MSGREQIKEGEQCKGLIDASEQMGAEPSQDQEAKYSVGSV